MLSGLCTAPAPVMFCGEWLPQQRQETLRKCLVGAIEISLGVGPRLEGMVHQFRFDDSLASALQASCARVPRARKGTKVTKRCFGHRYDLSTQPEALRNLTS
jgi:hypothetical protein